MCLHNMITRKQEGILELTIQKTEEIICFFANILNANCHNFGTEYSVVVKFKGVLHLLPKISMFYALSQNNQRLFEKKKFASYQKMFKELKNCIEILVGQAIFKL